MGFRKKMLNFSCFLYKNREKEGGLSPRSGAVSTAFFAIGGACLATMRPFCRDMCRRNDKMRGFLYTKRAEQALRPFALQGSVLAVFGDVGEVAVVFTAVKTVADHKVVGDGKERDVRLEVDEAAGGLIKESDDAE